MYGNAALAVLSNARTRDARAGEPLAPGCAVLRAEVVHAVTSEMAIRLSDVVFRRTDLASEMPPADAALEAAAELTASLLDWSVPKRERETAEVRAAMQL
jgi:glycerol-3-phosphate dehydrogenase